MTDLISPASSDEALMALCQKGEQRAYREIFERHQKGIYNYIYRFTGNSEETEEVFQEVFVKLYRAIPSYQPTAKFSTWLFTIVRNLCIDHHRKAKLRRFVSFDELNPQDPRPLHESLSSEEFSPHAHASGKELGQILEKALQEINEDQREVFLMREKMGLKFEEIANMLNVSVNTVKSRMRYALENLKKSLFKLGYQELYDKEFRF